TSLDEQKANERKIRDFLELKLEEKTPEFVGDLDKQRSMNYYIPESKSIDHLSVVTSILESDLKKVVANIIRENQKSDLLLSLAYNTNAYDMNKSAADLSGDLTKTETPTTQVGLTWTYIWGTDAKRAITLQAEKEEQLAQLKLQRAKIESESLWEELNRRYNELSNKILAMTKVTKFQRERAEAEQDKLSKGRSITSQVITSEQEASDTELNLIKLKSEQRKLECQGLLFTEVKG
ncbi:MAG: hypothetical protein KDD45_13420, partial [Bdellovibrionales bacterium]|nr:hypothetical protein [Bdellovibrionales bacterium]